MKICIIGCRHPFRTKKSQQAMNKKEFLTKPSIKKIYIYIYIENIPLKLKTKQGCPFSPLPLILLEALANAQQQGVGAGNTKVLRRS